VTNVNIFNILYFIYLYLYYIYIYLGDDKAYIWRYHYSSINQRFETKQSIELHGHKDTVSAVG
jgi:hypothetical protein